MVGFYDAVREFIVYRLAGTFEKVSTASLGQALRLEGTSLDNLVRPAALQCLGTMVGWPAGLLAGWLGGEIHRGAYGAGPCFNGWVGLSICECVKG